MPTKKIALCLMAHSVHARRATAGVYQYAKAANDWHVVQFETSLLEDQLQLVRGWDPHGVVVSLENEFQINDEVRQTFERQLFELNKPIVNIGDSIRDGISNVSVDPGSLAEVVLGHFAQLGIKQVGFVNSSQCDSKKTIEAYSLATQRMGVAFDSLAITIPFANQIARHPDVPTELRNWLTRIGKPVGIVCDTDQLGVFVCRACEQLRIDVPSDAAVVGPRNYPLCELAKPPLTSCRYPADELGYFAAKYLDRRLDGLEHNVQSITIPATELVVRHSSSRDEMPYNIAVALKFIHENACEGIGVPDVLRDQPVSRVTFERHFRAVVGRPPGEEIRRVRTETAAKHLRESEKPVSEIAKLCGFENPTKFSLFFKKATGMSPTEYRKT